MNAVRHPRSDPRSIIVPYKSSSYYFINDDTDQLEIQNLMFDTRCIHFKSTGKYK